SGRGERRSCQGLCCNLAVLPASTTGDPVHHGIQEGVVVESADHVLVLTMAGIVVEYGYSTGNHSFFSAASLRVRCLGERDTAASSRRGASRVPQPTPAVPQQDWTRSGGPDPRPPGRSSDPGESPG